jgi:hypothetical protein
VSNKIIPDTGSVLQKTRIVLLTIFFLTASFTGCAWVGETAGQASAKVERSAEEVKRAYHQGYEKEQGKSRPAKPAAKAQPAQGAPAEAASSTPGSQENTTVE